MYLTCSIYECLPFSDAKISFQNSKRKEMEVENTDTIQKSKTVSPYVVEKLIVT